MNLMNFLTPAAKLKLEFFHKCSDLAMYKHSSRVGGCLPLSEQCALSTVVLFITSMLFRIGRDRDVPNGNRETLKQLKDLQRASSFSSHVYIGRRGYACGPLACVVCLSLGESWTENRCMVSGLDKTSVESERC